MKIAILMASLFLASCEPRAATEQDPPLDMATIRAEGRFQQKLREESKARMSKLKGMTESERKDYFEDITRRGKARDDCIISGKQPCPN